MKLKPLKLKPLSMLFLSVAATVPTVAVAQNRGALEEIIVTAQKREEAIQDVPIAISALSADALEKQGIANLNDFQKGQVPSLKVVQFAGRPNTLQFGIRGITEGDPSQLTSERPIAVYVDGLYVARGNGMDTEVFDIERMEILRGPQGTLFGRNAEGGAINIATRKPTGSFGLKQVLEGSSLDEYMARTLIDTPEWNGLSASLGYVHRQANGWINNPGGKRDFNYQNKNAYLLALEYKTDDVIVDYSYDRSKLDYMQNYNVLLSKPRPSLNPRPVTASDDRPDQAFAGTSVPNANTEGSGHALTVEWNVSNELTAKSITGYRTLEDNNASGGMGANVFLPQPFAVNFQGPLFPTVGLSDSQNFAITDQNQFTQEFQLIGDMGRVEWQVGALYFHEDGSFRGWSGLGYRYSCPSGQVNFVVIPGLPAPVPVPAGYGSSCLTPPTLLPSSWTPSRDTLTNVSTDSYGLYGQATWNPDILDDRLKVTLGLRYGKDDKDVSRPLETGRWLANPIKTAAKSERVDPALTIGFRLLDETSMYARYSTAYRGGGVSVREIQTFTPYGEEQVKSTEFGIKSVFWDSRARINMAAFYNEIDNFLITAQQTNCIPATLCTSANTVGYNAPGTARTHGMEFDSSVLVVDGLTLSFAYTYLDSSVPPVTINGVTSEFPLNSAPRNSWSLGVDYAFEPFSFGALSAHIDASRSDAYCFNPNSCEPNPAQQMPAVTGGDITLVNARLTLANIGLGEYGAMTAALWVKNLTDENYLNFGYPAPSNVLVGNNIVGQFGDPRSIGATLTYQY